MNEQYEITEAELEIMQALWKNKRGNLTTIMEELSKKSKTEEKNKNTIKTLIHRLIQKGAIESQKVNNKEFDLKKINDMNSVDALDYLMSNKGIGEKVASCILLFSYCRLDVFPIDTWVKKFMKEKYNIEGVNNIRKFTEEKFGKYSGLVIQYMFHYKRNKEL